MAYISICVILPVFCNFVQVNVLLICWANSSITLWLYPKSQRWQYHTNLYFAHIFANLAFGLWQKSACILLVFLPNCTSIKNWQHCIPFVPHLYISGQHKHTRESQKHTSIKIMNFFLIRKFWNGYDPLLGQKIQSFYDKTSLTKVTYPLKVPKSTCKYPEIPQST